MNYQTFEELFSKARTIKGEKRRKRLEKNTYLYKEDDCFLVKLHNTFVVKIFPDNSCVLNSGGWFTPTTKDRINRFSPENVGLSQENKVWYLNDGSEFFDGIIVRNDGTAINPLTKQETKNLDKKRKQLNKMISEYIKGFCMAVKLEKVGYPDSGDCWYCCMVNEDGESLGDISSHDHIIKHMEENYFVPSLLYNAFKESHKDPDFIYQFTIEAKNDWQVRTTLRRYFKQRFNELLELI
jgi:hypothetical protein